MHVAIIGAGIAGLALAHRLARAGLSVCLYERAELLSGASGVPGALMHAPQSADLDAALARQGLHLAWWGLETLRERGTDPGLQTLPIRELRARRAVDIWHHDGGWLRPRQLAQALCLDAGAALELPRQAEVTALQELDVGWRLTLSTGESAQHDAVVLCCAGAAAALRPELSPLLQPVSGQLEVLSGELPALDCAYAGDLTVLQMGPGQWLVGASYQRGVQTTASTQVQAELLAQARNLFAPAELGTLSSHSWFATRWVSPDRRPLIGAAPQSGVYTRNGWPRACPGLWLNLAHGSRGFTSAFLAAELLTAQITERVPALALSLQRAVDPGRFGRR